MTAAVVTGVLFEQPGAFLFESNFQGKTTHRVNHLCLADQGLGQEGLLLNSEHYLLVAGNGHLLRRTRLAFQIDPKSGHMSVFFAGALAAAEQDRCDDKRSDRQIVVESLETNQHSAISNRIAWEK